MRNLTAAIIVLIASEVMSAESSSIPGVAPEAIRIPAGVFIEGSDRTERETAYELEERAYGHSRTRQWGWYEREKKKGKRTLAAFEITKTAITNRQYAEFVAETGHRVPEVDETTWLSYGLVHPYSRTRRHAWSDGMVPAGREDHPVVLVSHEDAAAYARWLSDRTGDSWRLPSEAEWEKAARGIDGRLFPWGDRYNPGFLNSHDTGPFDTLPVGRFAAGRSPFGGLDMAGQVFEWTATPAEPNRFIVKGGSWDDKGCGVCRPAARHARPRELKHILIGFRLVRDTN